MSSECRLSAWTDNPITTIDCILEEMVGGAFLLVSNSPPEHSRLADLLKASSVLAGDTRSSCTSPQRERHLEAEAAFISRVSQSVGSGTLRSAAWDSSCTSPTTRQQFQSRVWRQQTLTLWSRAERADPSLPVPTWSLRN